MIDIAVAEALLDFASRGLDPGRARAQLEGAVALHNLLERHGVAYLADEVGMGKTMVALGTVALFRHFQPDFRVLVIAPRENIQKKWEREAGTFFSQHLRFADIHGRGVDDRPARPRIVCDSVMDLVEETLVDPNRDFFARLTSFSLGLGNDVSTETRRLRERLRRVMPWVGPDALDLRDKDGFKRSFARLANSVLPDFDLVIVDEAHNLKGGVETAAARNRVLAALLGGQEAVGGPASAHGTRCKRVLLLSATPVEDSYRHLSNQLAVFGRETAFPELVASESTPEARREAAARFLIRRVTELQVGGKRLTRNLYRSEWRRGGVVDRTHAISPTDDRQKLVVALLQKKVGELLGHERFRAGFQIGMLASFESFLETSQVVPDDADDGVPGTFDDAEQTADATERAGIDTGAVNQLAASYRRRFGAELPHPKMDAVVEALTTSWLTGEKTLVFVRRVASVKELRRKLEDRYDVWLLSYLRERLQGLPTAARRQFEQVVVDYQTQRKRSQPTLDATGSVPKAEEDRGGTDTFFAWFFRGEGPKDVFSGAVLQKRFKDQSGAFVTFFSRNHVAEILGVRPGQVTAALAQALGVDEALLRAKLAETARSFLRDAQKQQRADVFEAFQKAAVQLLHEHEGPLQTPARIVWQHVFDGGIEARPMRGPIELGDWLEQPTFFTELMARPHLRKRIWPESKHVDQGDAFRESELRAQLLAAAQRLGHGLIDLWIQVVLELQSIETGRRIEDGPGVALARIQTYLEHLDGQRLAGSGSRWNCLRELADIAAHFEQILESNAPEAKGASLRGTAAVFGRLLGRQQPIGGMAGAVNQTLVRQFRMPGYPLVLISTDLLQEGEDLHFFCSSVIHYGIEWMPSAMEQRVGRVDRVRSLAHRRMQGLDRPLGEDDKVQVYYPYLADTVEVVQVATVLRRMDRFLELMHEDLVVERVHDSRIDTAKEMLRDVRIPEPPKGLLRTAFAVRPEDLRGDVRELAVMPEAAVRARARLAAVAAPLARDLQVTWTTSTRHHCLLGTVRVGSRVQPFTLYLESHGRRLVLKCISPVGSVDVSERQDRLRLLGQRRRARLGAIETNSETRYDLTVEADVVLGEAPEHDAARAVWLVRQVVEEADQFEQDMLPGRDHTIDQFQPNLEDESHGDR